MPLKFKRPVSKTKYLHVDLILEKCPRKDMGFKDKEYIGISCFWIINRKHKFQNKPLPRQMFEHLFCTPLFVGK